MAAPFTREPGPGRRADGDDLVQWAERTGRRSKGGPGRGGLRFAFYGRVSTEDWQDPVTSRARQREQARVLVAGHGKFVAEFFDSGHSRTLPWARRPQSAALVAALADPDRGWDAIVIGEYERAFYASQYASMAPLFEHYGISLWLPEVGGRVDWHAEDHEQTMLALGLSSKREITRTRIRVRTAMAAQTREQGRYLGGRPPYGYRLADAGPHPNKAHAAWGRRAHRLEPDPVTAPVVRWMFAQRLAGHSAARITRALTTPGSRARPRRTRNGTRTGPGQGGRCARWRRSWLIPGTPAGRCGTGSAPTSTWSTRPTPGWGIGRCSGGTCPRAGSSPSTLRIRRWSARPTSSPPRRPARRAARPGPRGAAVPAGRAAGLRAVRTAAGISLVQRQARLPVPPRPYQRRRPRTGRPKNTYVREDQILPHLAAMAILLAGPAGEPGAAPEPAPSVTTAGARPA